MTVGLVIVSHSTQLAKGVAELAAQMAHGQVAILPAGGSSDESGDDILGTSADRIVQAIQEADSGSGVLVLLDMGSAILSAETALDFLDEEQRQHVQLSYAPLVEGAISAALEASLGHTLAAVRQAAEQTGQIEQLLRLKPVTPVEDTENTTNVPVDAIGVEQPLSVQPDETHTAQFTITNSAGLHARPASLFVQTVARFHAKITIERNGRFSEVTGLMSLLSLSIRQGETITVYASGPEAGVALAALRELVEANFYEPVQIETVTKNVPPPSPTVLAPAKKSSSSQGSTSWYGTPTSTGAALGSALLYTPSALQLEHIERHPILPAQIVDEQQRLRDALQRTSMELEQLAHDARQYVGKDAAIFSAQALMLGDPQLLNDALTYITHNTCDAASALADVAERHAAILAQLEDPLFAARATDVRDAASRAIAHLRPQGETLQQQLRDIKEPVILIAPDLTPSDTALLRPDMVVGICTVQGGPTAHAAILARALGIPALAGVPEELLQAIHAGQEVGLDADKGVIYTRIAPKLRKELTRRIMEQQHAQEERKARARQAAEPLVLDGQRILLLANVGGKVEAEAAREWQAEGIGLLRTEFLLANTAQLPDEAEQRQRYIQVFRAFMGDQKASKGPIVVRTLDAGADKPMPALQALLGSTPEANPALGVRGIRIHLAHQELLEQQLRALLLAAADTGCELHIMCPMITTVTELRTVRAIFARVHNELRQQQGNIPTHVPLGIMVEVPAAAIMAPELAEEADFFSIGSNDLTQYTLACDRTNTALSALYNSMEPAVLRLIRQVAHIGRLADKPVAVCGEMASDPMLAALLVGLGVTELSMTPNALPNVRASLTRHTLAAMTELAERAIAMHTAADVKMLCEQVLAS